MKIQVLSKINVGQIENLPIQVYSDGSVDIKIPETVKKALENSVVMNVYVTLKCPAGLLAFRYFLDYVEDQLNHVKLNVFLPYLPNMRQDRLNGSETVTNLFSLKSVTKLLKSSNVRSYLITDPHSEVSSALLDQSKVLDQSMVYCRLRDRFDFECDVIVAPDAGAFKKSEKIASMLQRPLVLASKHRDAITNELTDTQLLAGSVVGKHVVIVDDILDGGRTFSSLAKVLKEKGASVVSLFVTHGIFSYGYESLKGDIDNIYVYYNWLPEEDVDQNFIKTYMYV